MTDYSKDRKKVYTEKKQQFYSKKYQTSYDEENNKITSKFETDRELQKYSEFIKTFKPDIRAKHPSTFAFYGSAVSYYEDAIYNILNYYPFDGTRQEILEWHQESSEIDSGILKQIWPSTTGHMVFNYSEYVDFYAGPKSISQYEFTGNIKYNETGLKLSGEKGNTVEFWLKKSSFNDSNKKETVIHVGTYPGKEEAASSGEMKIFLSGTTNNSFHVTYKSGSVGIENHQLKSSNLLTTSSISDSNWHHYAFMIEPKNTSINIKTYLDGKYVNTTTATISSALGTVDNHMAGCLGANISSSSDKISGSVDEVRLWKGIRTPEQISKFYDKKIYASNTDLKDYTSRLGLKYSFNREQLSDTKIDSLVIDSSGNDILGRIKNYSVSCRSTESAIDQSTVSDNTEVKDPILEIDNTRVKSLREELDKIGSSFDKENSTSLSNYLPQWTRNKKQEDQQNKDMNFLLQLLSGEFDSIKRKLDSIKTVTNPNYSEPLMATESDKTGSPNIVSYNSSGQENSYLGCTSSDIDNDLISGNECDFFQRMIEDYGVESTENTLLLMATPEEEYENIVGYERLSKSLYETRNLLYRSLANSMSYIIKKKGTQSSYSAILNSIAGGEEVISTNIIGMDADLFLNKEKIDQTFIETKSVNFLKNQEDCLYLSSSSPETERSFIESSSIETEYTFEGTFLFPAKTELVYDLIESSIFGVHGVSNTNNNLTFTSPDHASFQVFVKKGDNTGQSSKFILKSDSSIIPDLETDSFYDVYGGSKWNIAIRVVKDQSNKFLDPTSDTKYKVEFIGNNYLSTELLNSFSLSSAITKTQYDNFNQSNKTIFLGAHRNNITGSTVNKSDIKALDFNAWSRGLTDEEITKRSKNFRISGFNQVGVKSSLSSDKALYNDLIFRHVFDTANISDDNTISIEDASGGSLEDINSYGSIFGHKYNLKSTQFTKDKENVVATEFIPSLENIPMQNLLSKESVQTKDSDFNKFDIDSRPLVKILSFEKSMYRAISDEMMKFLGGLQSFNNLIGEPVNKYRESYKDLDFLRQIFYSKVKNQNQFERYVDYYRWIDKTIGEFLEQFIPASMLSNTGIENVVESHTLERNKYEHKYGRFSTRDLFLETNLLAINELLYDWEHGHYNSNENENCLWQRDRKVKQPIREPLRKVLTTVVTGSDHGKYFDGYVLRNLIKPYVSSGEKFLDFKIGHNKNANKIDLFYSIIDSGKEISLKRQDISKKLECDDIIDPDKKERYFCKVDVSGTSGYLDGDSDLLLPFSLYSSSAGVDFSDFKDKLKITNNLEDFGTLQSFWIKDHIAPAHRKVKLNQFEASGSDGFQKDRPEAYHISASSNTFFVKEPTNASSKFHRNIESSRFYNISNIKTEITGSRLITQGNYEKDYEIVKTSGRNINNTFLVDTSGETLTSSLEQSPYIQGLVDYRTSIIKGSDIPHTASVTYTGQPNDTEFIRLVSSDGTTMVYEFDSNASWTGGPGRKRVVIGSDADETYANLNTAVISSDGHNGKIAVSHIDNNDNSGVIIFTQVGTGTQGSTTVTHNLSNASVAGFDGGIKTLEPTRTRREHVFVTRFSPLGGPETHGAYGRDRVSGEFSIFNSVNYRNRIVRDVYDFISQEHSVKFGYRPVTSSGTGKHYIGSLHKTNRNELRFTGSLGDDYNYDNFYVQHHIPQQDFQYSWITASANEGVYSFLNKNANYGHQHRFNISGSLKSSETIEFVQSSQVTGTAPNLDLSNLNSIINKSLSKDENLISVLSPENVVGGLNSVILNRQGPFGWPSWKQTRGSEHPVVRFHRRNNTFSTVERNRALNVRPHSSDSEQSEHNTPRSVKNFNEILITNRFKPTNFSIHILSADNAQSIGALNEISTLNDYSSQLNYQKSWNYDSFFDSLGVSPEGSRFDPMDLPTFSKRLTITNRLSKFANQELQVSASLEDNSIFQDPGLLKLNAYIINTDQGNDLDLPSILREINYSEKIFPKEINTFTRNSRQRSKYKFFGWNSVRETRSLIFSGSLEYGPYYTTTVNSKAHKFFPKISDPNDIEQASFETRYFDKVEHIDLNKVGGDADVNSSPFITSSTWVLDSRKDYSKVPLSLTASFMNSGSAWMATRTQGTRGEGILQNDYSVYPLGINNLYGAPPISPVYTRRVPQKHGSDEFLAGEARWDKGADHEIGPFYDTYEEFSKETRILNQQRTIIPEFTISRYAEDVIRSVGTEGTSYEEKIEQMSDFLEITGAVYNTSSHVFEIGSQFFKTYSTGDFLKYFADFKTSIERNSASDDSGESDFSPFRITFKCKATKRFLPYRGFYPAERAVQISEIFSRCYLRSGSYKTTGNDLDKTMFGTELNAATVFNAKVQNSRAQATKALFGPGVLFNSIKTGMAVDYPIFSGSAGDFETTIERHHLKSNGDPIDNFPVNISNRISFITGSIVNSTPDSGIPRIKADVSRRITFDDLLDPQKLFGAEIFDNEPHPSGTLYYGSLNHFRVLDRPFLFGTMNRDTARSFNGLIFKNSELLFESSMSPYKSAMENFAVQTVEFFLKDEKLNTIISEPVKPYLEANKTYVMRVYLHNAGISMYDRHSSFGPPVDEGTIDLVSYAQSMSDAVTGTAAAGSISLNSLASDGSPSTTLNNSTVTIIDHQADSKTYIFKVNTTAVAATGSINFSSLVSSDSVLDTLLDNSEITFKAVGDSSSKTYRFTNSSSDGSTGQLDSSGKVTVQVNGITSFNSQITQLINAINSGNGHGSGKITAAYNSTSKILTLTQVTTGAFTDAITGTDQFAEGKSCTPSGFDGGVTGATFTTGDLDSSSNVIVATQGLSLDQIGTQLQTAIAGSSGHNGDVVASYNATTNVITLTQNVTGSSGNTTIGQTGGVLSPVSFTGGTTGSAGETIVDFFDSTTTSTPNSHGYLPYVAPFLDPNTTPYAEISFTPDRGDTDYTIPEIIEKSTVTYHNGIASTSDSGTNHNLKHAMNISASLNLKAHVTLLQDNFTMGLREEGPYGIAPIKRDPDNDLPRWVIQTKWETPVLDFSTAAASSINLDSVGAVSKVANSPWKRRYQSNYYELAPSSSVTYLTSSTGMWHQSGTLPKRSNGYVLSVAGPAESESFEDLSQKLGFSPPSTERSAKSFNLRSIRDIGQLASSKEISEAIVVIPYWQNINSGEPQWFDLSEQMLEAAQTINSNFSEYAIQQYIQAPNAAAAKSVKKAMKEILEEPQSPDGAAAIAYQLRMMDKYILPPQFDFIRQNSIKPHVQYFFQFKAKISKEQLKDLWENVYPDQGYGIFRAQESSIQPTTEAIDNSIETFDVEYLSNYLDVTPMQNFEMLKSSLQTPEEWFEKDVRWLVFKVKFRANSSYECLKLKSISDPNEILQFNSIPKPYQNLDIFGYEDRGFKFNWPYDYFSIIEGAEIDAKVDFYSDYTGPNIVTTTSAFTSAQQEGQDPLEYTIVEEEAQKQTSKYTSRFSFFKSGIPSSYIGYNLLGPTTTQAIAQQYSVVGSTSTSSTESSNLVIRQKLKGDDDPAPSPANQLTIEVEAGFSMKTNSESIYVNGILQAVGSTNDYTISGTTITFAQNIDSNDSVYVTYLRESSS